LQDPPKFTQIGIFWFENLHSGNPAQNRRKKHPIPAGFLIAEPQQQAVPEVSPCIHSNNAKVTNWFVLICMTPSINNVICPDTLMIHYLRS
jgi:hypothetical protein